LVLCLRCGQCALRAMRRLGRQHRRAFEERGGGGKAPARLRSSGRAFQLRGNLLVRPHRRVGPMPRSAVRIEMWIGHIGQRAMHLLQVAHAGRAVGRRAHQRMTETHPRTELDEPRGLGRPCRVGPDPKPLDRSPQQGHVADGLGRRREEE
jgi:hypothetical protein